EAAWEWLEVGRDFHESVQSIQRRELVDPITSEHLTASSVMASGPTDSSMAMGSDLDTTISHTATSFSQTTRSFSQTTRSFSHTTHSSLITLALITLASGLDLSSPFTPLITILSFTIMLVRRITTPLLRRPALTTLPTCS